MVRIVLMLVVQHCTSLLGYCLAEETHVDRVFEVEFSYEQDGEVNWKNIEERHGNYLRSMKRPGSPQSEVRKDLSIRDRKMVADGYKYISGVMKIIEVDRVTIVCESIVQDMDAFIVRWAIWKGNLSGVPFTLSLIHRNDNLIKPNLRLRKRTEVVSKNGATSSIELTLATTGTDHGLKVIDSFEAIEVATNEVRSSILSSLVQVDSASAKSILWDDAIVWVVWFEASSENAFEHLDLGHIAWIPDVEAKGEVCRLLPVAVYGDGSVNLGRVIQRGYD